MLQIRPEQMEALEQAILRQFEQRAVRHVEEAFPKHARFLGNERVRQIVRLGLERARQQGLASERGLFLYLDLMFLLGADFARDPQLPWAAEILAAQDVPEPQLVDRLLERSKQYLERVVGPQGELIDAALQRVRQAPVEGFAASGGGDFEVYMRTRLSMIYPEKCLELGEEGVRGLLRAGVEFARSHGLRTERGVVISIVLLLFLGSGFADDPQFPWAAKALSDPSLTDPAARADRLHAAAKEYLERWLS